ncbi:MAG: bifunctional oligoribonuclease/PAP phosphatase NrnA [Thermoleophilaceae bacterium]|nr:bifunctional oligoribonuclease/PAP phosphatase NrnA [Thermoleophilaceae bacterium]
MSVGTAVDQVIEELRQADKLLLTTHENPDGDALGSLLGMHEVLGALGKDSVMFMAAEEFPLPREYRHLPLESVIHLPPEDLGERTIVFLDCGNIDRMPAAFLQHDEAHILNIDHHHDNTCFGTVNLVDAEASCTAQIVFELAHEMGVELTHQIAVALYIGLVTDTGRFMYENTSPRAHRMAADLLEQGVRPEEESRALYEGLPFARLKLLERALQKTQRYDGGTLTLTHLTSEDFETAGAEESDSEGIVDHMRAVEGTKVAALVRERNPSGWKVSLRATDGLVDVSQIARALGGGGHRQAAGAKADLPLADLIDQIRAGVAGQL